MLNNCYVSAFLLLFYFNFVRFIVEKGDLYLVLKKKGNETPDEILLIITPEYVRHLLVN